MALMNFGSQGSSAKKPAQKPAAAPSTPAMSAMAPGGMDPYSGAQPYGGSPAMAAMAPGGGYDPYGGGGGYGMGSPMASAMAPGPMGGGAGNMLGGYTPPGAGASMGAPIYAPGTSNEYMGQFPDAFMPTGGNGTTGGPTGIPFGNDAMTPTSNYWSSQSPWGAGSGMSNWANYWDSQNPFQNPQGGIPFGNDALTPTNGGPTGIPFGNDALTPTTGGPTGRSFGNDAMTPISPVSVPPQQESNVPQQAPHIPFRDNMPGQGQYLGPPVQGTQAPGVIQSAGQPNTPIGGNYTTGGQGSVADPFRDYGNYYGYGGYSGNRPIPRTPFWV
jgi:hypothetical protein